MDTQLEIKYPSAVTASLHHASSDISYQEQIREFFIMNTAADIENTGFELELAQHIITALNMDMNPAEIDPLAPLHGDDGLGIDSIDVLEISLMITKQYGVQLRSDDANNARIFASLRNLANHVQQYRIK